MGELARRSGLNHQTIHYYIRKGYLEPPLYKSSTQALYDESHLEKLLYLKEARSEGLPLAYAAELWKGGRNKPSGRRRRVQSGESDTRERIVRTATSIFLKNGYQRTTISEIVDTLGVTKPSFYYYFENKRDVYFVCLDQIFETVFGSAYEEIRGEKNPMKRWEARWRVTSSFIPEIITILQLAKESLRDEDEEHMRRVTSVLRKQLIEPLIGDLNMGIKSGLFRDVPSEIIAYALLCVLEVTTYRPMIDEKYGDQDIKDALLGFILNGLLKDDATTFA
ncbi:MAG: TetR family transcriptional regulator [Actinomycetota bacterium]